MLGRRLLLLVAVLLATGAIAAALTPRDLRDSGKSTATTAPPPAATTAPGLPGATGGTAAGTREVSRTIDAEGAEPAVVRARVGNLLHLVVRAPSPDVVELDGTGRFDSVDSSTPARFDFFVETPGTFPIRLQETGQEIGRLVVSAA
jgi:hypothetical protein